MPEIGKLISGFRAYKATTFAKQKDIIHHMIVQGSKPTTLVISCSDIRIAPADLFATNPGDLYVVSNVGGLVPKYETKGTHGVLAAIEYAVKELEVENILVLGHTNCNSIKMLMTEKYTSTNHALSESMKAWLTIAEEARQAVKSQLSNKSEEEQITACERESVIISMRNLFGYPYIMERFKQKKLNIFGWHFNAEEGEIIAYNAGNGAFEAIS